MTRFIKSREKFFLVSFLLKHNYGRMINRLHHQTSTLSDKLLQMSRVASTPQELLSCKIEKLWKSWENVEQR